jgi:hypothetical protein
MFQIAGHFVALVLRNLQDIARRVAIDRLVKELREKWLLDVFNKRYGDDGRRDYGFCLAGIPDASEEEQTERNLRLIALITEFSKSASPERFDYNGSEQQDPPEEVVDQIVRQNLEAIRGCFEATRYWRDNSVSKPEPANEVFLNAPKLGTTLSAINDWSSTSEAKSLKHLSEKALIEGLRDSLVGAKATAAFCCGGSVPFREPGFGRPIIRQPEVEPVTLRWDNQEPESSKIVFSAMSSALPGFQEALDKLCHASEPASFGRGDETVYDGELTFFKMPYVLVKTRFLSCCLSVRPASSASSWCLFPQALSHQI